MTVASTAQSSHGYPFTEQSGMPPTIILLANVSGGIRQNSLYTRRISNPFSALAPTLAQPNGDFACLSIFPELPEDAALAGYAREASAALSTITYDKPNKFQTTNAVLQFAGANPVAPAIGLRLW